MSNSSERKGFWRKTIKHYIVEACGNKCCCCNKSFEDCCYDLHHTNPDKKDFNCSAKQYNGAKSWLNVRNEVCKCVLVCSNCHRLIHNGFLDSPTESNFNMDYYDWDLTNYKQISSDLQPIDKDSKTCPNCGEPKSVQAKVCVHCCTNNNFRFNVSREELKSMIRKMTFVDIGKAFGVSDNTVRKRCKLYNLPYRSNIIRSLSDEEWENECFDNTK